MRAWPALLTRMSQRPIHWSTAEAKRSTALLSSTSHCTARSLFAAEFPSNDDFAAASRVSSRPQIATAAPSARNSRAVASPTPGVPPVTTATLSFRPRSISLQPACGRRMHVGRCHRLAAVEVACAPQRLPAGQLDPIAADPPEPTGNLATCRAQALADGGPALLSESGDRSRHIDGADGRAGKIEYRHRRRADPPLERRLAPGDPGRARLFLLGL